MAKSEKSPTVGYGRQLARPDNPEEVEIASGWKYKRLKFGPITLPWYASPEAQLILVSFVCFLCPGKRLKGISRFFSKTDYPKACLMPSTASAALAN